MYIYMCASSIRIYDKYMRDKQLTVRHSLWKPNYANDLNNRSNERPTEQTPQNDDYLKWWWTEYYKMLAYLCVYMYVYTCICI